MLNLPEALVGVHLLRWIVAYPVDKVIRSLNNWGLVSKKVWFAVPSFCYGQRTL